MKRRIVKVLLVGLALWPIVHFALVLRFGIDPWKLFGWAMYSVPGAMKTVRVIELSRDGGAREVTRAVQGEAMWRVVSRYRVLRQSLGSLAGAEATALHILALRPDWEGVALPVLSLTLDRETASVRADIEQASFWRDGSPAGYVLPISEFQKPRQAPKARAASASPEGVQRGEAERSGRPAR